MAGIAIWLWDDEQGRNLVIRTSSTKPEGVPETALEGETDKDLWKEEIMLKLDLIDKKSIRALREGNAVRVASLEDEAAALRTVLQQLG